MKHRTQNNTRIPVLFFFTLIFTMMSLPASAKEGVNFTGTWLTGWGPVSITQTGSSVNGSYTGSYNGKIEGSVDGNRLRFKWIQTGEWGRGYFDLSTDGKSFTGRWGGYESDSDGGAWNGKKK